jgi:uncharacterized membrane protein
VSTLLIILMFGIAGVLFWFYRKGKRTIAWLLAIPAFLLAATVTPWRDALATLTSTRTGLLVLVGIFIVSAIAFYFEAIHGHMHHHITSAAAGIVFATSLVMVIGHLPKIMRLLARSPGHTARALAITQQQITSGHAARHMNQHSALMILLAAAAGLVVLAYLARRVRGPQRSVTLPPPAVRRRGRAITGGGSGSGGGAPRTALAGDGLPRPVVPFGGKAGKR